MNPVQRKQKTPEWRQWCRVPLLLTLYRFHTILWCFHCWLWTSQWRLSKHFAFPNSPKHKLSIKLKVFPASWKPAKVMPLCRKQIESNSPCLKSVRIRSYSGSHFPAFGLTVRMTENADQNNYAYGHVLRSGIAFLAFESCRKSNPIPKQCMFRSSLYFVRISVYITVLFSVQLSPFYWSYYKIFKSFDNALFNRIIKTKILPQYYATINHKM